MNYFEQKQSMLGLELINCDLNVNFDDFNSAMMDLLKAQSHQWCQEKTDRKEASCR